MKSCLYLYHTIKTNNDMKTAELAAMTDKYFECQLIVLAETEKAVCFDTYAGHLDKNRPVWIPKSQMEIVVLSKELDVCATKDEKRYFIKNWLYSKLYN